MWNNELELALLECYQAEPILWQSKHKDHKNKNKVYDAWVRISGLMNNIPVADLKKKKESLMSSYRTYKKKVKDSTHSGAGSSEIYKPIWFAFETMDSFLGDGAKCNNTINTEEPSSPVCADEEKENVDGDKNSQPTLTQTVRRRKNPSELLAAGEVVKDALSTLKATLNTRRIEEDDECDLHGKVIAKKLRQLPEDERMQFVCEIYKMFVRRDQSILVPSPSPTYHRFNNDIQIRASQTKSYSEPGTSYQRASSSHSNYYSEPTYYYQPPEIHSPDRSPASTASQIIITSNKVIQPATKYTKNCDETVIEEAFIVQPATQNSTNCDEKNMFGEALIFQSATQDSTDYDDPVMNAFKTA